MGYVKAPPAPLRFIEGEPIVAPVPVALVWPSIAALVTQDTAPVVNFQADPTDVNA